MKKKILFLLLILIIPFIVGGCANDSMDEIDIIVTNYANEYIVRSLYDKHSTITSIYPDGILIDNYKISKKQKQEYARSDLFVYNGLIEKERNLALELLAINPELKIIDTAYVLETEYSPEELWLNPSSLLMMSQNVRRSLKEYASSAYLKKDIDEAYNELKINLSELDAEYRLASESTNNRTIIVANSALNYLEKFGLNVICIDDNASQKTLSDAENIIYSGGVSYIFKFNGEELSENAKAIMENYSINTSELHRLDNITDQERSEKKDYISIMKDNLESIKKELYQ